MIAPLPSPAYRSRQPMHDHGQHPRMIDPLTLLRAYASGIFPMALEDGNLGWFAPDPRGILPIDDFHIPHGLRRALRKNRFEIRVDTAFARVMQGCANRPSTWIDQTIFHSYLRLHDLGHAHSVEAWLDGELVGGLYGVALRGLFCGESMFSRKTDASKICLVHLIERLRAGGFVLLDTQWTTPHLTSFGAIDISRDEYLARLDVAMETEARWEPSLNPFSCAKTSETQSCASGDRPTFPPPSRRSGG